MTIEALVKPVKAANYQAVESRLYGREAFDHSTMSARWVDSSAVDSELVGAEWSSEEHEAVYRWAWPDTRVYVVYSYQAPVAMYFPGADALVVTATRFSRTTTRHQNLVKNCILADRILTA